MASLSIWHWVFVLLIIGAIVLCVRTSRKAFDPAIGPSGFGGWLMLLAMGQVVAPLRTLAETAGQLETYKQLRSIPGGGLVANGELMLNLLYFALQVVVAWFMFRKSNLFPKLYFYQWLTIPLIVVLDILFVSAALGVGVNQLMTQDVIAQPIGAFIGTGLWLLYLSKSVRVRNTFVR